MSTQGQTAKKLGKALTAELPGIADMVRPRGNALRLLVPPTHCELLLVRSLSVFGKKLQMVRRDFSHAVPETFTMVDGRRRGGPSHHGRHSHSKNGAAATTPRCQ